MELNSRHILTQVFHQNCKELHLDDDNTRFIKWASDTIEITYLYVISLSETSQIVVCGVVILSKALNRDALKSKYSKIPGDQGVILTTS